MRIAILIEGKTECAFLDALRSFLQTRLEGKMPKLDPVPYDGGIPKGDFLRRDVSTLLNAPGAKANAVIALTDVYTGSEPPDFADAADAKKKMREWVGNEKRFHPHAAQYDFEAWLLPYWGYLQELAGHDASCPGLDPEKVDNNNPPSKHIQDLFRRGSKGRSYVKARDAGRILRKNGLSLSISKCRELRELVNTILQLCGEPPIS